MIHKARPSQICRLELLHSPIAYPTAHSPALSALFYDLSSSPKLAYLLCEYYFQPTKRAGARRRAGGRAGCYAVHFVVAVIGHSMKVEREKR